MPLGTTTVHLTVFHCVINDICGKRAVNIKTAQLILQTCPLFFAPCRYQSSTQNPDWTAFNKECFNTDRMPASLRFGLKLPASFLSLYPAASWNREGLNHPTIIWVAHQLWSVPAWVHFSGSIAHQRQNKNKICSLSRGKKAGQILSTRCKRLRAGPTNVTV